MKPSITQEQKTTTPSSSSKQQHKKSNTLSIPQGNPFFSAPMIQTKLTIGQPGDRYEQQADAMANKVMSGKAAGKCSACAGDDDLQMKAAGKGASDMEEEILQTKSAGKGNTNAVASAGLASTLSQNKGNGSALSSATNATMSQAFGTDFSHVNIHQGSAATQMNQELGARAFTNGSDIYFNQGQYAPNSSEGKRLLAHELTHVVQQGAAQSNLIQRDLATPPPAVAPPAQPDLTPAEIASALRFNKRRYNNRGTQLIQDLIGPAKAGTWVEADILAIADMQERFGLQKDGKVGEAFFRFLDTEVSNEKLAKTNANCLTSLNITRNAQIITPLVNGADMGRFFTMQAQFPAYCNCADYEYRQFIRGHFTHERAGVVTDEGSWFSVLPAGRLNAAWQEDGDTTAAALNYGHRTQPQEAINRYVNDAGGLDMANGCRYRGNDTPGGQYRGNVIAAPTTGDTLDILVEFRGEVQRNGNPVQTQRWTGLRDRFVLP